MASIASSAIKSLGVNCAQGVRTGVSQIFICGDEVQLFTGDRHFLKGGVLDAWQGCFHPADTILKGAPPQVLTVTEEHLEGLTLLGTTYSLQSQAGYILDYCVSKGFAPKIFFNLKEAHKAVTQREYSATTKDLQAFMVCLRRFTDLVKEHHYEELVFGKIEVGETVEEARAREVLEESGQIAAGKFLFDTPPRNGKVTAVFLQECNRSDALDAFKNRSKPSNWQCPLFWAKVIPDIDVALAKAEKALCETIGTGFYPIEVHPNMDTKNRIVIEIFKALN